MALWSCRTLARSVSNCTQHLPSLTSHHLCLPCPPAGSSQVSKMYGRCSLHERCFLTLKTILQGCRKVRFLDLHLEYTQRGWLGVIFHRQKIKLKDVTQSTQNHYPRKYVGERKHSSSAWRQWLPQWGLGYEFPVHGQRPGLWKDKFHPMAGGPAAHPFRCL